MNDFMRLYAVSFLVVFVGCDQASKFAMVDPAAGKVGEGDLNIDEGTIAAIRFLSNEIDRREPSRNAAVKEILDNLDSAQVAGSGKWGTNDSKVWTRTIFCIGVDKPPSQISSYLYLVMKYDDGNWNLEHGGNLTGKDRELFDERGERINRLDYWGEYQAVKSLIEEYGGK